jgi:hypothetical protein
MGEKKGQKKTADDEKMAKKACGPKSATRQEKKERGWKGKSEWRKTMMLKSGWWKKVVVTAVQ